MFEKMKTIYTKYPNTIRTLFGFCMFTYFAATGYIMLSLVAAGIVLLCGRDAREELKD
ncbi:MAG: hypothetical protein K6C34_00860 [Alphaproteobacteria bacterium]|nr:hypothetical protein [Alphaproteobacteria bacterium]